MTMKTEYRACVTIGALIAASLALSGCLGPTYGTEKSATEQLVDDLGNIASIGQQRKGGSIEYKPRPDIVKPPQTASLPEPQQSVSENNPAWVESPEQTRKRLIAEADGSSGSTGFSSPLARRGLDSSTIGSPVNSGRAGDGPPTPRETSNTEQKRQAYIAARKLQQGAYSDRRRYLSDPPLTYRKPSESAPIGELGEPEKVKERRRIAEAKKAGTGKRSWWPW
jgi:hypothetical protein